MRYFNFKDKELIDTMVEIQSHVMPMIFMRYKNEGEKSWTEVILNETQFRALCLWRKQNSENPIKIQCKTSECKSWISMKKDGFLKKEFSPNARGLTPISINALLTLELI